MVYIEHFLYSKGRMSCFENKCFFKLCVNALEKLNLDYKLLPEGTDSNFGCLLDNKKNLSGGVGSRDFSEKPVSVNNTNNLHE